MAHKHMSLESVLDEERKEVLAILEGTAAAGRPRGSASSTGPARTGSPFATPRSPVRSMLDVDPPVVRHSSLPGTNGGGIASPPIRSMLDISSPPPPAVRSMLDISTPLSSATVSASTRSAQTSPTEANHRAVLANSQHRSLSDASSRPADFGPRAPGFGPTAPGFGPTSQFQFSGYLPSNPGGALVPKRNTQAGKKVVPSAMAEVVRGGDLSSFGSRDRGRNHSMAGTGIGNNVAKSKSPSNRLGMRTSSPHSSMLNPDPPQFVTKDGRVIDMNSAYRRLSDANLAKSGGGLSSLSEKSRRRRTNSGDAKIPEDAGGGRLEKDYIGEDALEDSSDEDARSSDEERSRGRRKEGRKNSNDGPESKTIGMGRAKGPRTAQSLMAAAEEERAEIAAKYKIRSLLDPEITVTAPTGDHPKAFRTGVHPNTAFDEASGLNTPVDSDTEADLTDIKRAQNLPVHMTTVISTPATKRCVRTIYRGDFAEVQKEAKDHNRRVRQYLVATDLSDEAAHALEWTIGTVLRDGDTLLAIYCVDEELGIAPNDGSADDQSKEQVAAIALSATKASASTPILGPAAAPSSLGHGFKLDTGSASASPMGRGRGKAEQERYRAVQDITERVSKLLRKTRLQVKVVIEVIHCKSPKHLINEVIDFINPTLVILGSRGRSALKGVILGSFSNYLVTKSSVPVMVARKRLRKHTKYKRPDIKLTNNLSNPIVRSLASAKID